MKNSWKDGLLLKLGLDKTKPKVPFIYLWRQVILDYFNKNRSLYGPTRQNNFYADAQATFSGKDKVTYLFTIDGYGTSLPISFATGIRLQAIGDTKVNFVSLLEPTNIDWGSAKTKSKLRTWKAIDAEQEEVDAFNLHKEIASLDTSDFRKASLVYLSNASIKRERELFVNRTLMLVSGVRGESFDKSVKDIEEYCEKNLKLKITRVNRQLPKYLEAFSPFKMEGDNGIFSEVGNSVIPDEILARFRSYDQGKIGEEGMYWGSDIYSNLPVLKKAKEDSGDAENWLVIGETGGGKSFFNKIWILQFLADPQYNLTILDIEGDEYLPIAYFAANNSSVEIINMAEGSGKYFDPVSIPITGDPILDEGAFQMSKDFTIAVLQTLVGKQILEGTRGSWANKIIRLCVARTYERAGVNQSEPGTWARSNALDLYSVFATLEIEYSQAKAGSSAYRNSDKYKDNEDFKAAFDEVFAALEDYFSPDGVRNYVFKEKVTMKQVADAKMVLCSFGMKGKSPSTVDEIQMGLTMLNAGILSNIRSNFSKAAGKFNVKVFEEFQRYSGLPSAEKVFNVALTGGRKLGDVNIIITNKPSELLASDSFGVFENTTSFAIGAVGDSKVREELCERLSMQNMLFELDRISSQTDAGNKSTQVENASIYKFAFLVRLNKRDTTITRVILPQYVAQSDLFRTAVDTSLNKG